MCGIIGCVGKIYGKEEDVFKLLAKLDTVRGEDSTGILSVTKNDDDWLTLKDTGTPYELFPTGEFKDLMKRTHLVLFAHNRAATKGKVTIENAHPFNHGNIIGCHNGTLTSTHNLDDHAKFEVDSENIFYDMSRNGAKKTIEKLQGAFTLCWYDEGKRTINLVRNAQRPMSYCYSKDHKTLFWASESWMLHVAMMRCGLDRDEIHNLPEGQMLTVDVPRKAGGLIDEIKHTMEGVDFYKFAQSWEGGTWYSSSKRREDAKEAFSKTKEETKEATKGKVVPFKGGKADKIPVARFLGKTVVFSVIGRGKQGNLEHIKAEVEDEINPPEVRVFCGGNTQLANLLLNSTKLFKGKVKSVSNNDQPYLLCDNRTIIEVEYTDFAPLNDDDEKAIAKQSEDDAPQLSLLEEEEVFEGYNGKKLTREQYAHATQCGCALCSAYASLSGKDNIVWISPTEYFCEGCAITDFARDYLTPTKSNLM